MIDQPPSPQPNSTAFACPRCGSDQIQALSLVHNAGSITGRTVGGALGITAGGDVGYLGGSGVTSSRSALAVRAAPPQPEATDGLIGLAALLLLGGLILGAYWEMMVPAAGIGLVLAAAVWYRKVTGPDRYNRDVYPGLVERWRRTFMCGRCGEFFEIERTAAQQR